jgi:rhodanese-related sulfurtransferase
MYRKIKPVEAKAIMDMGNCIIVDVREEDELEQGYIDGSVLVSLSDFEQNAARLLTDKHAKYLLYCRSGRRSAEAGKRLVKMGYENVLDFGGIMDWPFDIVM